MNDGEALEDLITHYVVIHALMMSWYPRRRPSNPTGDVMMDLDPWRYLGVVEVVEEGHEAYFLMTKPLDLHLMD